MLRVVRGDDRRSWGILAGPLARVDFLEDAEPIRGGEAPPLNLRRHLRVRIAGA